MGSGILIKLLKYLKKYWAKSVFAPIFKMIEAVFELFVPLVVAAIIDEGIGNGDKTLIVRYCLLLVVLALVGFMMAVLAQYFASGAAAGFATEVRGALFNKVMSLPAAKSNMLGSNRLITMLSGDVDRVQTGVNMVLRLFMRSPVVVFGAVIMAFVADRRGTASTGWIFVAVVPLLSLVVFAVMVKSIKLYKNVRTEAEGLTLELRENLTGARVFRSFGQEKTKLGRLEEHNRRTAVSSVKAGMISALTGPFTMVIINAGIIVLLYSGAVKVHSELLTAGQLIALYNYMSQILVELVKLANLIVTVTKSFASGDRIAAVLEPEDGMERLAQQMEEQEKKGLVFEHVSMTYPDNTKALEDISFSLGYGGSLGIIGGTGAGKSTVASLVARFYDPTEGRILYNGRDLRSYDEKVYRRKIGLVPQKAELFKGTVRDNLLWGNQNASDEELWQALEAAQAAEVVRGKKEELDEQVEQFGKNFSGGQKQRLTIARALLRKPEILVLDDSASALDYATDRALRKALSSLPFAPAMVVISQRASSVMHLEKILVLDNGRVVGYGNHDALLQTCPIYREIYESQFGGKERHV